MARPDINIEPQFSKLGVRIEVVEGPSPRRRRNRTSPFLAPDPAPLQIDVRGDARGEYFHIYRQSAVEITVADVRPADRHLLLIARIPEDGGVTREAAYLCGRDERHWFVAAIPENTGAYDVQGAKDALKPPEVWDAMARFHVPMSQRDQRRTRAFIRQGEWFFIPTPDLKVNQRDVLHDEPIQRGGGKPHVCQFLHRVAGQRVWVSDVRPNGITDDEARRWTRHDWSKHSWRSMVRGAHVHVKGNIRHPDHKTIWLSDWHEVVMNRETESKAMQDVAFLD
jgi:hypothetical protein